MKTFRYSIFALLLLFTSCHDYLTEIEPGTTLLGDFFTSTAAAEQNVTACYVPLMWEYNNTYLSEWFIGDIVSDDALKGGGVFALTGGGVVDEGDLLAVGSLTLGDVLVDLEGGADLQQGDGGSNCCDKDQEIEHEANEVAEGAHVLKDSLHRNEQQTRATAVIHAECCAGRHNSHTRLWFRPGCEWSIYSVCCKALFRRDSLS